MSQPPRRRSPGGVGARGTHRTHGTVRIGLTGPIGCGKSTVARWLDELGAGVVDADRVAHEVTAPGTPALASIARTFGSGLVRADGSLDRSALARMVFSDPGALARLEGIVHPAVRPVILDAMAAAERAGAAAVVVEAIKLVEGGLAELCDEVWLVTCSPAEQLARLRARLAARGGDPATAAADAEARIAAQSDLAVRLAPLATRVLDTSGSLDTTRELVTAAYADALSSRAASADDAVARPAAPADDAVARPAAPAAPADDAVADPPQPPADAD